MTFMNEIRGIPAGLYVEFQQAYGAVVHGVKMTDLADVDEISKGEALEYAADFLVSFAKWLNEEEN